jgi:hypothetical protein
MHLRRRRRIANFASRDAEIVRENRRRRQVVDFCFDFCRTRGDRVSQAAKRWSAILFAAVCAWWYWQRCWLAQMPDAGPSDFQLYYRAAQHVAHGRSPFFEGGYIHPPLLACLMAPLALLEYVTARWIWFVASHAAMLLAACLLWRHLGRGSLALAVIAFVWAAGGAGEDGFGLGQLDSALVLLLVLTITARGRIGAAAIATGFGLKLFPGLLFALPALEWRWRRLAAAAIGGGLLLAVPWAVVVWSLKGPKTPLHKGYYLAGTPCVLSWSLPSVALRTFELPKRGESLPPDWVSSCDPARLRHSPADSIIALTATAAAVSAGLLAIYRAVDGQLQPSSRAVAGVALMSLALAASPVNWWHYGVLHYPGVAILLFTAVRRARLRLFFGALINSAFIFPVPAAVCRFYYRQHEVWPDYPVTVYFWTAAPAAATVILFVLLTGILRSDDFHRSRT